MTFWFPIFDQLSISSHFLIGLDLFIIKKNGFVKALFLDMLKDEDNHITAIRKKVA